MKNYRIARRYAQALFELAQGAGELEAVQRELLETTELVGRYPEISYLLRNTTIAREEKEDFLEKILPEKISAVVLNFVKVLIKKRRFQDLGLIQEEFRHLYEEKKGMQRVRVESAVPLDDLLQTKLKQALEKRTGREIFLETAVRPELLGGLVLDFVGSRIDGSYRTALQELKQSLLA